MQELEARKNFPHGEREVDRAVGGAVDRLDVADVEDVGRGVDDVGGDVEDGVLDGVDLVVDLGVESAEDPEIGGEAHALAEGFGVAAVDLRRPGEVRAFFRHFVQGVTGVERGA